MSAPPAGRYPCPYCGGAADLDTGCPSCGRPPDPEAAEVIALNATGAALLSEVESARRAYTAAVERLNGVRARRNALARRVMARAAREAGSGVDAPAPAEPTRSATERPPDAAAPTAPGSGAAPETTTRTTQNILFVLGGLLLGSAAVVFTAVAWATYGVGGRAAILAALTALALAAPLPALRRGLTATAETFAAVGLLLVLLDGYAAWYVDLAGLADVTTPAVFAGLVFAATTAIAAGYSAATGLTGPRFAALATAQPVAPLLAADADPGPAGWAAAFAAAAATSLVAVWLARRDGAAWRALRVAGWVFAATALAVAAIAALAALAACDSTASAARAAGSLVLVAAVGVAASFLSGAAGARRVADAAAVLAVAAAAARFTAVAAPEYAFALVAAELVLVAVAARIAVPAGTGAVGRRTGAAVAVAAFGAVAATRALAGAVTTVGLALPPWRGYHPPLPELPADWQLPAGLLLVAGALAALLPRAATGYPVAGGAALATLALPVSLRLAPWAPSMVDGLVLVPLVVAAVRGRSAPRAAAYGAGAALLALHAVAAGLATPANTAAVLAGVLVVALVVAGLDQARHEGRPTGAGARLRTPWNPATAVGAVSVAAGLLALPGLAAAVARLIATAPAAGATAAAGPAALYGAAFGLAASAATAPALRRWWPEYALFTPAAVGIAATGVALAALGEPAYGAWAAWAVLATTVAAAGVLPAVRRHAPSRYAAVSTPPAVLASVALLPALAAVTPAVWAVLALPYTWLGAVWTGAPAGAGLTPPGLRSDGYAGVADPVALGLLALATAAAIGQHASGAGRDLRHAAVVTARWAGPTVALSTLVAVAALDVAWPAVAGLSLATGVAAALAGARGGGGTVVLTAFAALAAGAGLAGALATPRATLAGLGVVVVAATACGVAARRPGARAAGWLVAVASAGALALAAGLAADLAVRWAAFGVLGAAATALAVSAVLRHRGADSRRDEAGMVEVAAHATAVVALLLTAGSARHAAAVCTLWGASVGLRALRPGEPGSPRRLRVAAGAGCELVAYWLLLVAGEVALLEAYTLPAAAVALLAGWLALRGRPGLGSWPAYGPALLAGFGPSLATILATSGEPARRLALGAAALAVVVLGARRRMRAPVVVGGGVLVVVALHEAVLLADLLPRWVPLAAGGLLLVAVAMRYERSRRDVARLRAAVGQMR